MPTSQPGPAAQSESGPTPSPGPTTSAGLNSRDSASAACQTNDLGDYGSVEGTPLVVTFIYELETEAGVTLGFIDDDVFPVLERSFNEYLLPVLFPNECGPASSSSSRLLTAQNHNRQRRLKAIGLSTRPKDVISPVGACSLLLDTENSCFVVHGQVSLFSSDDERRQLEAKDDDRQNTDKEEVIILEALKSGMNEESTFDDSHPVIKRVSYLEPPQGGTAQDVVPPESSEIGAGDDSDDDFNAALVGSLVGVAAVVLVLLGIVFCRRRPNRHDQQEPLVSGTAA